MSLEELEQDLYERSDRDIKRRIHKREVSSEEHDKPVSGQTTRDEWRRETWPPAAGKSNFSSVETGISIVKGWHWRNWRRLIPTIAAAIFLVAVMVGGYYIYASIFSKGVSLSISLPEGEVRLGVPFTAEAAVNNVSGTTLTGARVSLELPEGVVFARAAAGQRILARDIGTIGDGSITKEAFELIAVAQPQTISQITGRVLYKTGSLGSEFEANKTVDLVLGEPVVKLDIAAPRKVFSGERFDLNVSYQNMSEETIGPIKIELDYPAGFNFLSSSETMSGVKHNWWEVDTLLAGEIKTFTVTGTIMGPADSFFSVGGRAIKEVYGTDYAVSEQAASVSIQPSPLALSIHLNDDNQTAAHPGDILSYVLVYENNTSIGLEDVIITARLAGVMFDFGSLTGNGAFNSARRMITWNAANNRTLTLLPPGASGTVSFSIKTLGNYPITKVNDKDFELLVEVSIESSTVPEDVQAETTVGVAEISTKVTGKITVDAQARFRDAPAGFVNEGVWPPVAETPTQYTVRWALTNYATDVDEVEVSAFLGAGVRFTGNVKSNVAVAPQYNERTQEVVWRVGKILATKGVVGAPVEAIFQIEAIPSAIMAGSFQPLAGETRLTAADIFTGEKLSASDGALTTNLVDDSTVSEGEGKVVKN